MSDTKKDSQAFYLIQIQDVWGMWFNCAYQEQFKYKSRAREVIKQNPERYDSMEIRIRKFAEVV